MDVCDPDIWIGEKVITAVVVVNEVMSRLDAVGVERSVVLETRLTAANWLRLERGVVRTPSTLVREGRARLITVGVIKVLVGGEGEGEGMVKMAILSTPTGEEMVGVSRCSETLGPSKDGFGFELPCRCCVTEGIGETCVALGASLELNTLPV